MNRTIKGATVRRFHYDCHTQLQQHLGQFIYAYDFVRRLKTQFAQPPEAPATPGAA